MMIAGAVALERANVFTWRRNFSSAIDGIFGNIPSRRKAGKAFADTGRRGFQRKIVIAHKRNIP